MIKNWKAFLLGSALDPLKPGIRQHLSLIALLAWVGLGADALSSACYGPEEAYLALGGHSHLALYIAIIMILTIFIISIGYNQVIELFPNGGGGYQVASKLLHPYAGLVAGSALIIDYILTITVSIVSGTDAIFSFLPPNLLPYKLFIAAFIIILLMILNLRGMKETIYVLAPIFFGFILVHIALIVYGIFMHRQGLQIIVPLTIKETQQLVQNIGWLGVIGLTLHAYSLGSGTYTGIEAISNNVHRLAEPRVSTGKRAMYYMAISLSFTAGGLILLYLLWNVQPQIGKTLNAVLFHSMLGDSFSGQIFLIIILLLEASLLLIAANAGFAAGPNVLANMAINNWVPSRFRYLSNRLVIQNGLMFFGLAAVLILFLTNGNIKLLIVLYSINVFITFSLSLLGVSIYWIKHRRDDKWKRHFILSVAAFLLTSTILMITIFYKFKGGGWITLFITFSIVLGCILIKRHYRILENKLLNLDKLLKPVLDDTPIIPHAINPKLSTAIIFVNNLSVGFHTLLTINRIFPGQFKNFVFLSGGIVDVESFSGQAELEKMQKSVQQKLDYLVKFCYQQQIPAEGKATYGTDLANLLKELADETSLKYPHGIFFATQLVFQKETILTRWLHNHTPLILQHHLHFQGKELMIMPMKI